MRTFGLGLQLGMGNIVTRAPSGGGGAETDPHWANVYALLPFDSALNQEVSGNSTWSIQAGSTGSSPVLLDGNFGDGPFRINSSSTISIGTRDFTFEGWIRPTNSSTAYQAIVYAPAAAIYYRNGKLHWYQSGIRCESASLTIGTAYHFMVTRSSGTVRLFINGVKSATDYASSPSIASGFIFIGVNATASEVSNCELDEIRLTLDVARETSNFTPRTTPFPRTG